MKRNKFSLSHYKLLTCDMGQLIPLTWYEALPGDSIQQSTACLIRVSPLLSPVMHPVNIRLHHWFVPYRLIWEDFEDFITGGPDGTSVPAMPSYSAATIAEGSLGDYLDLPVSTAYAGQAFSMLPFRAYQLIFNENYRDQDIITEAGFTTASGADATTSRNINTISWEKDYFTTCRPWEQKGSTVTIPLGTTAPLISDGDGEPEFQTASTTGHKIDAVTADAAHWLGSPASSDAMAWDDPKLVADLSSATGIDINDLRLALAIQRYQEARAQYGSRYVEYLRYLGIRSSDARLQRPEFLGGGRQTIQFSEVLDTGSTAAGVGQMKGHGIAAMKTNRYRRYFEEHGIVMTLLSAVPKAIYKSALNRKFFRTTKEMYFQKELQYLGDQEVPNKEIQIDHSAQDDAFGYAPRYDDYRQIPSSIAGEFNSTLNYWHYARIWSGDIALNPSFINAVPTKRVNASTGTDCLYIMANHSIQARRLLAKNPTPRTF